VDDVFSSGKAGSNILVAACQVPGIPDFFIIVPVWCIPHVNKHPVRVRVRANNGVPFIFVRLVDDAVDSVEVAQHEVVQEELVSP
jgi:hypothetical protein